MSHLLELIGFALLALAAWTLIGLGAAEAVAGASLLLIAQGVNDGAVKTVTLRIARRLHRPKA